jgi:hypothetical protein
MLKIELSYTRCTLLIENPITAEIGFIGLSAELESDGRAGLGSNGQFAGR